LHKSGLTQTVNSYFVTLLLLICGGWVSLLTGAAAGADRLDC